MRGETEAPKEKFSHQTTCKRKQRVSVVELQQQGLYLRRLEQEQKQQMMVTVLQQQQQQQTNQAILLVIQKLLDKKQ